MRVSEAIYKNLSPLLGEKGVWPNAAPEDAEYPMMIYIETNREHLNTLDAGFIGHAKVRVQMYVFAKEFEEVETLRDNIVTVMLQQTDLPSCLVISDQYQFESTVQAHLIVIEFSMWEQTE